MEKLTAGQRCLCVGEMWEDPFRECVNVCTGHRYSIGKRINQKTYEVINNKTGQVQLLQKSRILIEVNKWSDSVILTYSKQALRKKHHEILLKMEQYIEPAKATGFVYKKKLQAATGASDTDIIIGIWHGFFKPDRRKRTTLTICGLYAE